jgi:hypothetical protein
LRSDFILLKNMDWHTTHLSGLWKEWSVSLETGLSWKNFASIVPGCNEKRNCINKVAMSAPTVLAAEFANGECYDGLSLQARRNEFSIIRNTACPHLSRWLFTKFHFHRWNIAWFLVVQSIPWVNHVYHTNFYIFSYKYFKEFITIFSV